MKICPRCGKQFPDSEVFCEIDGTALTSSGGPGGQRLTTVMPPGQGETTETPAIECPRCGGKAQPGEVICNFCGARLMPDGPPVPPASSGPSAGTRVSLENYSPAQERRGPQSIGGEVPPMPDPEEEDGGRSIWSVVAFSLAAIIALIGGAWLALYLSGKKPAAPIAQASASPSPAAIAGPNVDLAKTIPIQIQGDLAGALFRDKDSMTKAFQSNKSTLEDAYKEALATDSTLHDGMIVRLHIASDGSVSASSVRTSTAANPSLDADVTKAMSGWKFAAASSTGVDTDFPIIFADNPADVAAIEADLNTKLASLTPDSPAEYPVGSAPSAVAGETPAAVPSPSPEEASLPPPVVPETAPTPTHHHRPPVVASVPRPPKLSLVTRVTDELHANRKLRRVQAYTTGGTVTLSGKVFDDNDKVLAESTARRVNGVTGVINNLTTDESVWAQNQARIQQQLQGAGLTGVTVKVIGQSAYLSGEVKTQQEKDQAVTITEGAAPVRVHVNLIRIAVGSVFGF
jgi:hypothetical protein